MIDGWIAWILLVWGAFGDKPIFVVAAGLFAIAAYIGKSVEDDE